MARNQTNKPNLTPGNVVFLYGVLRDALGTGKQTFITHVETALADKRLTAADLGFDSTQELLESLGDGIKLTIFKGGRLYATVVEHPEWDAALAGASKKEERKPGAKGNKPWKRKKGDKAIKPSCPKRVKREPEPKAEAHTAVAPASSASVADTCGDAVEVAAAAQATVESPGADAHAGTATSSRAAETAATHDGQPHRLRNANFSLEDEEQSGKPDDTESSDAVDSTGTPESDAASGTEPSIEAQPEPSIAVTIVYDPYTGIDEETVIKPTPGAYVPAQPDIFIGQAAMCPPPAPEPAQDRPSTPEAARAATKGASPAPETMHARASRTPAGTASAAMAAPAPAASSIDPSTAAPLPHEDPQAAKSESHHDAPSNTMPADALARPDASRELETSTARIGAMAEPAADRPPLPDDFPVDFATDVYCPGPQLHQLTLLYPFGADVLGIVGEYFHLSCERGDIVANRRRASFSIRYLDNRERKEAFVRITHRTQAGTGPLWSISAVEIPEEA